MYGALWNHWNVSIAIYFCFYTSLFVTPKRYTSLKRFKFWSVFCVLLQNACATNSKKYETNCGHLNVSAQNTRLNANYTIARLIEWKTVFISDNKIGHIHFIQCNKPLRTFQCEKTLNWSEKNFHELMNMHFGHILGGERALRWAQTTKKRRCK